MPSFTEDVMIDVRGLNLYYGANRALQDITLAISRNEVTALIGPSGCGKTSFLRCLNRMNDLIPIARANGEIIIDGRNILDAGEDVVELRKQVGMVFQRPNPFPMSIFDNIAYGPRIHGMRNKRQVAETVEKSLIRAGLWNEVKDRLYENGLSLSGGQQQRLCIARALAVGANILLMDEPTSALDPRATARIEELIGELRSDYTIVIVTHNMQQAARISDDTGFMMMGELIEFDATDKIFTNPSEKLTEDYVSGRFG